MRFSKHYFHEDYMDVDLHTDLNLHGVSSVHGIKDKRVEIEESIEKSSLQFDIPENLSNTIKDFCSKIDAKYIYEDKNNKLTGLANNYHCTVLYGILSNNFMDINNVIQGDSLIMKTRPFKVTLRDISFFEASKDDKYHIMKIDVESDELLELNKKLRESLKYYSEYPDYIPHVTLVNIKKDSMDNIMKNYDMSIFNGQSFMVTELSFITADNKITRIDLLW